MPKDTTKDVGTCSITNSPRQFVVGLQARVITPEDAHIQKPESQYAVKLINDGPY